MFSGVIKNKLLERYPYIVCLKKYMYVYIYIYIHSFNLLNFVYIVVFDVETALGNAKLKILE